MAAPGRRTDTPLVKAFFDEVHHFEFFQAVRLLERIYDDRQPVGGDGDPAREVVRFRTRVSLNFPPSQLHQITGTDAGDDASPPELMVAFMGLTGPLGVLPHPYTEELMKRIREKDNTLWEFLDLFNHRLISLFYRAWQKYRLAVGYEKGRSESFTGYLFDLIGLGTRGLHDRLGVKDESLIFYSGLIAQRPHSAFAMEALLSSYFGVPAKVQQFAGQWLKLDEENWCRLGTANHALGHGTVAGTRVWDDQSKFRLKLGPLTFAQFVAFLPVGNAFKPVSKITRLMVGQEFDFDVQLTLRAEEVPRWISTTHAKRRPMLGWTTWLKTREFRHDDSQVVLTVKV